MAFAIRLSNRHFASLVRGYLRPNQSIERTSRIKPREAAHFKRWAS